MLGPDATPAQIEATRVQLGLDRPLHEQLLKFYARSCRGTSGAPYFLDRPVTQALLERAEPTALLTFSSLLSPSPSACRRASSPARTRARSGTAC